jgi:hypothetical protein
MKLKNKLLHDNREDLRKNILDRRADELEVDFKEINRKEVLERKNMVEMG